MRSPIRTTTVLLALILTMACASFPPGYVAASKEYEDHSALYAQAWDTIRARLNEGRVSDAQWKRFKIDEAIVIASDKIVYAALELWKAGGTEQPTYRTDAKTLKDAQDRVIVLAAEVSR